MQRKIDHQFDLSNTVLVTDRGYHSLMNMQKLINLELKFVQGVTRAEDSVRRLFDQHRVSLDDPAFTDGRLEVAAYTTTEMWQEDGAAGRQHIHNTLHLYQDGCLRAEQKRVFLKNLDETIDRLNQGKKWIRSSSEKCIGTWSKRSLSTGCAMPRQWQMRAATWATL